MAWGQLTVGPLVLKETHILQDVTNANTQERTVRVEGRETNPGATLADLEAKQADIMSLIDRVFAVTFQRKALYSGFYRITDTNTELEKWPEGPMQIRWGLAMDYIGPDNAVDVESRLVNVVRQNDFASVGERWHAPPIGHYGYYVGPVVPTSITRTGESGTIKVYRSIPAGVNPRWGCSVGNFTAGRVRLLSNGIERVGTRVLLPVLGWEINNGLIRVRPATPGLKSIAVAAWANGAWREREWDLRVAGSTVETADWDSVHVNRCDREMVSLRVLAHRSDGTRVAIDISLRRGARFVEGYTQRAVSGNISVIPDINETWADTSASGYVASYIDTFGLRWGVGSAKSFTLHAQGGIDKTAVTSLDWWIGAEVGGPILNANPYFETDANNWFLANHGTSTFVRSTAQAHQGVASGLLTPDGTALSPEVRSENVPATAAVPYRTAMWGRCAAARNVNAGLVWRDSGGTLLNTDKATIPVAANTWTYLEFTATSIASTAQSSVLVQLPSTPPNTALLHIDEAIIQVAPQPGDLITNLRDQYIAVSSEQTEVVRR